MGSPASYQQEQGWRFPFEEGFMHVAMILAVLAALAPQERAQDEVIQLKGEGKLIVGKVTGITDTTIEVTTKDGKVTLDLGQVHPTSIYKVRAARLDPKSAE